MSVALRVLYIGLLLIVNDRKESGWFHLYTRKQQGTLPESYTFLRVQIFVSKFHNTVTPNSLKSKELQISLCPKIGQKKKGTMKQNNKVRKHVI